LDSLELGKTSDSLRLSGGMPMTERDRQQSLAQTHKWSAECTIRVVVYWIDADLIQEHLQKHFLSDSPLPEDFDVDERGLAKFMTEPKPKWTTGLTEEMETAIKSLEDARRGKQQFFTLQDILKAAQGIVTFYMFDYADLASHGCVAFGGDENVLLEFASVYLNSTSGMATSKVLVPVAFFFASKIPLKVHRLSTGRIS
jgi:hypothetical protein